MKMKRIYKNHDLLIDMKIEKFPINYNLIEEIEFRIYTTNVNNYIQKTDKDVNSDNVLVIPSQELFKLDDGVIYYSYEIKQVDSSLPDFQLNTVNNVMTDYYLLYNINNVKDTGAVWGKITGDIKNQKDLMELIDNNDIVNKDYLIKNYQPKGNYLTEIPSEYITEKELSDKGYLTEVPAQYVTESELNAKGYLTQHQPLTDYAKTTWVNQQIEKAVIDASQIDLSSYAKKTDLNKKLDADVYNTDKLKFATKIELDKYQPKGNYLTSIPSEYVTENELSAKGYLTEHQSLANYALKEWVTDEITKAQLNTGSTVDLSSYAKKSDLNSKLDKSVYESDKPTFASKEWVNQEITKAQLNTGGTVDLSNYYTKEEINQKGYLTSIPSEYITESELAAKGYLTEHQSLVGYATEQYVGDEIAKAKLDGSTVDLTSYAKKSDLNSKLDKSVYDADKLTFVTQSFVSDNYVSRALLDSRGYLTEIPIEYVTENELNAKGYLTSIPAKYITNETLLAYNYATKAEVNAKADKSYVDEMIGNVNDKINSIKNLI